MTLRDVLLDEILPRVERPSRYLGDELNSAHKDPSEVDLRICLFFPDMYELGLGNLGLHILYAILNAQDGVWAERGYSPAPDLEAVLRERKLPLFLYESKEPLRAADLIGFTLQSELTYTNVLNALDLGQIPLRADRRGEADPLIFAGGPAAYNPEPMAPFVDFFVIGDGEEAVVEVVNTLRPLKGASRRERLEALAQLPGVYVPALYPVESLPDGRVVPCADAPKIVKRMVDRLDDAPFPEKYLVPFTQLVHDGIGLEVLRGCTQGCRFCHAGMVSRPARERSIERIEELIDATLRNTGLESVSLVSLSTCDYSRARTLVERAGIRAHAVKASVSLPSLRLDSFAVELADLVADVRRSGLTFAPEAATPRMRAVINKFIADEDLLEMACEAYRRGWQHVKTYFMIGLPTERDEDVQAIADLCIRTLEAGRRVRRGVMVRTGVSTFVPKPWTPFQWAPQMGMEETVRKQQLLSDAFRKYTGIKFGKHAPESSWIEGLIARGDRRTADLIEAAWRHGARLETWSEHCSVEPWRKAIAETGFDVAAAFGERDPGARLPWDHIDPLVSKTWLREEWARAMQLEHARDCRSGPCNLCGVMQRVPALCKSMRDASEAGRIEEAERWTDAKREEVREKEAPREAIQRIRLRIGRVGEARLLGHLEMQNAWIRILRRASAPLAYSQGFHAHPRVSFATAAPLGEESEGDYLDVMLFEHVYADDLFERLRGAIPRDFRIYSAADVPLRDPSLMSSVTGFAYTLFTRGDSAQLEEAVGTLLEQDSVFIDRQAKAAHKHPGRSKGQGKPKETVSSDIRPLIVSLEVGEAAGDVVPIQFMTRVVDGRFAKPREIVALLNLDPAATRTLKRDTLLCSAGFQTGVCS
jgi:radical SAM family uncharacterized protein/radical SAM-linked protein